jgi:ribosomal protein S18 acetylase RimI-like enzyme
MSPRVDPVPGLETVSEIIALHNVAWHHSTGIIDLLRCSTHCFVLRDDDDRVVGYAFLEHDPARGHAELQDVVVSQELRGRGLGRLLLHAAMDACERIKLIAHENDAAIVGFYEKLGFSREAVIENYYAIGDDGLRMSWSRPLPR